MAQWVFEFTSPDLQAKIEIASALVDPSESHVFTHLLTHLIEESPTTSWQTSPKELTPEQFHGLILAAVARSYSVDFDPDFKFPAHEILQFLISHTKDEFLQEILPADYDDEDNEQAGQYSLSIWRK